MNTNLPDVPMNLRRYDLMRSGRLTPLPPNPDLVTPTSLMLMLSLLRQAVKAVGDLERARQYSIEWDEAHHRALAAVVDRETEIRVALFTAHAPVAIGDRK